MLKLLVDYAQAHGLESEPGFAPKEARWAIRLSAEGEYLGVQELGDPDAKRNPGLVFGKAPEMSFTDLKARGETKCHFLIETASVVALHGKEAGDPKNRLKHEYFVKLLRTAGETIPLPELRIAAEALSDPLTLAEIQRHLTEHKAKPTDKVTLQIGDAFPARSEAWQDWWRDFRAGLALDKGATRLMRCLATGRLVEPAATHPKIAGLADVGGQSMGATLIGFDKEAFASYYLDQSANCALAEETAAAYRSALNELIRHHSERLAGARVVHWFRDRLPLEDDPLPWLSTPPGREEGDAQKRARDLLAAIHTGQRPDLARNRFYALTVSGAGGRVMVRDWMEGQFEELLANVEAWFGDLAIVARDGSGLAPNPKFMAVLGATVRELDQLAAPMITRMWRAAVRNEPIPDTVVAHALARVRAALINDDARNTEARMGLLKAYHLRKHRGKGGEAMSQELKPCLNEDHPSPAYQCGRIMAVLAALQRAALGDVGAGVVQRYYAAASSTPALVLGRLVRTSQFHLNKLEPGLARWYDNQLAGIWAKIRDTVPPTLTLVEQSLFALGYYQQLAHRPPKKNVSAPVETDQPTPEGESDDE